MINFKLAILNLKAKKFKYAIIFILIMITSISIYTSDTLLKSMERGIKISKDRLGADLVIVPSGYEENVENALFKGDVCTLTFNKNWQKKIKEINGVKEVSTQLYLATLPGASCCDGEIQLIAIDPQNDFLITPWISANNIFDLKSNEIILGSDFKIPVGDKITYYNKEFTVVAIMDETSLGYDSSAFISYDAANKISQDKSHEGKFDFESANEVASMIFVRVDSNIDTKVLKKVILGKFGTQEINVYNTNIKIAEFSKEIDRYKMFATILDSIIILIATISLFAISTITTIQRKNEIGSMYTIGIGKKRIIIIFIIEYLIISFSAIITSIVLTDLITVFFYTKIKLLLGIPYLLPTIANVIRMIIRLIVINLIIMIISLSCSFYWICKKNPADMIKEIG